MTLIRPAMQRHIRRWSEVGAAVVVALLGGALMRAGGYLLFPTGAALTLLALGWALMAFRRLSFQREVSAPGVVEIVEGQVGYFGPTFGGFIALADLTELRLAEFQGTQQWRLRTSGGEVLLIPTEASGAEKLFDAFATLPGIDMAALASALDNRTATLPLWRRPAPRLQA
ncbi:MAG: hypothetical protein ACRCS0_02775 [Albidovulum sp.]